MKAIAAISSALALLALCACGDGGEATTAGGRAPEAAATEAAARGPDGTLVAARCPASLPSCRSASGEIV